MGNLTKLRVLVRDLEAHNYQRRLNFRVQTRNNFFFQFYENLFGTTIIQYNIVQTTWINRNHYHSLSKQINEIFKLKIETKIALQ